MPDRGSTRIGWEDLPDLFGAFGQPGRWLGLLQAHAGLLERQRGRVRVSAVAGEDVVQRHYAESLEILRIAIKAAANLGQIVDVGSGGGFPGMVAACVLPDTPVALVEPLQRRARLLEAVAAELGLDNVTVFAERAEDAGRGPLRGSADVVTARAVAELRVLVEYAAPLTADDGAIVLPKGTGLDNELAAATSALSELGCTIELVEAMRPAISETLRVLVLRRAGALAERYPRRAGMPAKRPL